MNHQHQQDSITITSTINPNNSTFYSNNLSSNASDKMHFSPLALILPLLASSSSAYVVTKYTGRNCQGTSSRLNVWDNSCAVFNTFEAKSARVEVYGGWGQQARFHNAGNCGAESTIRGPWAADRANNSWKKGACIDFGGKTALSFGSFHA